MPHTPTPPPPKPAAPAEDAPQLCHACGESLRLMKTNFSYLRHTFSAEVPRCPTCGLVYISEKLVQDRMQPVEQLLEEK